MKKKTILLVIIGLFLSVSMGFAGLMDIIKKPKAKVTSSGGPGIQQAQQEAYDGPKARIAVSRFTDKTAKGWWTGQIGDSMADMLATALFNTNRFIVLERQTLEDVLGEQDLGASGRIKRETAAPIGQIEGAELLVTGAVTEFEPGSAGVGGGITSGRRGWGEIAAKLGGAFRKSHIAIDMRIIDTATSRLVAASSVEGEARDFNLGGLILGDHAGGGLGGYNKTPVEKAIRVALGEAVNFIASQTPDKYYHYTNGISPKKASPAVTYQELSEPITIYVKGEKANIRAGAGSSYNIVTTKLRGDSLTAIGKKGSWYHVELDESEDGYIYKKLTTTTRPTPKDSDLNEEEEEVPSVM